MLSSMTNRIEECAKLRMGYPSGASMQWMALVDGGQTLFFSGRDKQFYAYALWVTGSTEDKGAILMDMVKGEFIDEKYLENNNKAAIAKAFTADDKMAFAIWNDNSTAQPLSLKVVGYKSEEVSGVDNNYDELPKMHNPQQIVLALYKRL